MEMLIIVAIWTVVVKRGVEDIWHTARGGTPPRLAAARARRRSGAAGRYWGALRDDTFEGMLRRHNERVARRAAAPSKVARPRGAATQFFAGLFQDGRRAAGRSWEAGWTRLDEKRREKSTRPRPGQDTVPGEVVPNRDGGQDEDQVRPQDEDRPDPRTDQDEDGTPGQDEPTTQPDPSQQDQDEDEDPPPCPKCGTTMTTSPNIGDPLGYDGEGIYRCPSCDYKIRRSPEMADDFTQEGPTTMTATTTEVVGLDSAIRFCEDSARAYRAQMQAIEQTQAALAAGDVTGPAAETFAQAMEQSNAAAASMDAAAAELLSHKQVQEAYLANQGAGTRDFILAGQ